MHLGISGDCGQVLCPSHTDLSRLSQQAKSSGRFSSQELLNLRKEFQHHKDKIHEYNILIDAVSRTEGESMQSRALEPVFASVCPC